MDSKEARIRKAAKAASFGGYFGMSRDRIMAIPDVRDVYDTNVALFERIMALYDRSGHDHGDEDDGGEPWRMAIREAANS